MASLRAWHNYLSIFAAPTILFFALTGSLQLFDLHESHGPYQAPLILQEFGRLHKDQVFAPREKHDDAPKPAQAAPSPPPADDDDGARLPVYVLKWFCLLVALTLVTSTCLGVWIALSHVKRRRASLALLAAGTVIPLSLAML
jgi:hypothetical protein